MAAFVSLSLASRQKTQPSPQYIFACTYGYVVHYGSVMLYDTDPGKTFSKASQSVSRSRPSGQPIGGLLTEGPASAGRNGGRVPDRLRVPVGPSLPGPQVPEPLLRAEPLRQHGHLLRRRHRPVQDDDLLVQGGLDSGHGQELHPDRNDQSAR